MMLTFMYLGFIAIAIPFVSFFIIGMLLNAFGQSVLTVVMTSEVVGKSTMTSRGESLGIVNAIGSVATITAPILVGMLFEHHSTLPYILCSILSFVAFLIMRTYSFGKYKERLKPVVEHPEEIVI